MNLKTICLLIFISLLLACKKDEAPPSVIEEETSSLRILYRISNLEITNDTLYLFENEAIELIVKKVNADTGDLRYTIMNNDLYGSTIDPKTGEFRWTPDFSHGSSQGNNYEFIFAVTEDSKFTSRRVNFKVYNKNRLPQIHFYSGKTLGNMSDAGQTKSYIQMISFQDEDGDELSLELFDTNGGFLSNTIEWDDQNLIDSILATTSKISFYRRDMLGPDTSPFSYQIRISDGKDTVEVEQNCVALKTSDQ